MSASESEATNFRFLFSEDLPHCALLEFDTASKAVRVSLSQELLDRLATEAKITSVKLSWRSQGDETK
jgi:hypothetical protein